MHLISITMMPLTSITQVAQTDGYVETELQEFTYKYPSSRAAVILTFLLQLDLPTTTSRVLCSPVALARQR